MSGTVRALAGRVRRGALDPVDVAGRTLEAIERASGLGAVVSVLGSHARRAAARCLAGDRPVLAGVPVLVKDNICTRAGRTTCCSRMLADYRAPADATVVARLRAAGAVIVGKTTCDEFGLGSSTETAFQGPARNPHDPDRVPGGSSGGSAAAVAAGLVPLALGSDTGGSVRQPAAFCGVVGLKPTWGTVSRRGLVAFASSFDQIGPMGTCVDDVALAFSVMAGRDPLDATSRAAPALDWPPNPGELARPGGTLGVLTGGAEPGAALAAAIDRAASVLATHGMKVRPVRPPDPRRSLLVYLALSAAELSSNLARFDGVRFGYRTGEDRGLDAMIRRSRGRGFGPEVRRRVLLGTWVLAGPPRESVHARAAAMRRRIAREVDALLEECDLLLGPTTSGPAFRLGERLGDPMAMYASDEHTVTANLCGLPAISLPAPDLVDGLPLGIQLTGRRGEERRLLVAASVLERAGFAKKGPA